MKIYANADLHGDLDKLNNIKKKKLSNVELAVFAGDMTIFGKDMDKIFSKLNKLKRLVLIVHGNHEDEKDMKRMAKRYKNIVNIHKKTFVYKDVLFLGHGGGGFSSTSEDFEKISERFEKSAAKHKKVVFVIHQPPYKTECDKIHGERAGNKSYRKFIKKAKPDIVICGHLHENEGKKDKIGKSLIINPGWKGRIIRV